jgi:hypothetical protein
MYRDALQVLESCYKQNQGKAVVLELVIIGVIAGAVLGRYKVMILVPTIISLSIFAVVVGGALAYSLWLLVVVIVVLVVAAQVGYALGIAIRAAAQCFQTEVERKRQANLR